MKRIIASILMLAMMAVLVSCSGSVIPTPMMPSIAGAWEFLAISTTDPGYSTGVEVALQQGKVFNNTTGFFDPTGEITASGQQLAYVGVNLLGKNPVSIAFGGNCAPATSDPGDSLSGSISGLAGSMNFSYIEAGNVFNVTARLSADGKSMLGTYTEQAAVAGQSNGTCNNDVAVSDSGTITGNTVSKLSGTYLGKICRPADTSCASGAADGASATLSQSSTNLTVSLLLSGADNATLTLTGPVSGNAFSAQGTFAGSAVSYAGYFQNTFDKATGLYDIGTLYLANVDFNSNPPTQTYAGTLVVPQVP